MRAGGGGSPTHIPVTKRGGGNLWSWRNGEEREKRGELRAGSCSSPCPCSLGAVRSKTLSSYAPRPALNSLLSAFLPCPTPLFGRGQWHSPVSCWPFTRAQGKPRLSQGTWTTWMDTSDGSRVWAHQYDWSENWCPKTHSAAFWPGTCSKPDSAFQVPSICKPCFDFCFDCCQRYMVGHLPYTWPLHDTPTLHPADSPKSLSVFLTTSAGVFLVAVNSHSKNFMFLLYFTSPALSPGS